MIRVICPLMPGDLRCTRAELYSFCPVWHLPDLSKAYKYRI